MSSGHDTRKKSPTETSDTSLAARESRPAGKINSRRPEVQGKDRDMGSALRSAYEKTVNEAIPAEMLDLLGKLD